MSSKVEEAVIELVNVFVEKAHKVQQVAAKNNEQSMTKDQENGTAGSEGRIVVD